MQCIPQPGAVSERRQVPRERGESTRHLQSGCRLQAAVPWRMLKLVVFSQLRVDSDDDEEEEKMEMKTFVGWFI